MNTLSGPVTVPAGGRGIDQDGNGTIDSTEGVNAAPPYTLVSSRDGLRQTVVDLMQLVREIEVASRERRHPRPEHVAHLLLRPVVRRHLRHDARGREPSIRAGVLNVPAARSSRSRGSRRRSGRSSASRSSPDAVALQRRCRTPPFYTNFVENMPLRGEPIRVDTVPGASAIQEYIDRAEWVQQAGSPVPYARRRSRTSR